MTRLSSEYGFFSPDSAFASQKLGAPVDADKARDSLTKAVSELQQKTASKERDLQVEIRDVLDWLDDANPKDQDFMDDLKARLYRLTR